MINEVDLRFMSRVAEQQVAIERAVTAGPVRPGGARRAASRRPDRPWRRLTRVTRRR
jgi:hypothetical protein